MIEELIRNGPQGWQVCDWCGNSGWLYLSWQREVPSMVEPERTFPLPVLAPCKLCQAGWMHHERYPSMPWDYMLEDVDVHVDEQSVPPVWRERYAAARARVIELELQRTRPGVTDLRTGPRPAKVGSMAAVPLSNTNDSSEE